MEGNQNNLIIPEKLPQFPLLYNIRNLDGLLMAAEISGEEFSCLKNFQINIPKDAESLIAITDGEISMEINGKEYTGSAGSIFVLFDFQTLSDVKMTKNFRAFHIIGLKEFARRPLFNLQEHINANLIIDLLAIFPIIFSRGDFEELIIDIKRIIYDLSRKYYIYLQNLIQNDAATIVFDIFNRIERATKLRADHPDRNLEIVLQFIDNVIKNCKKERRINYYAERAFLSPNHFSKIIKNTIGKSASEIIHYEVIVQCEKLLSDHKLQLTEISEIMNFSEAAEFSRYFKKHTGITPNQFRISLKSEISQDSYL